jgi:hypothetical protein
MYGTTGTISLGGEDFFEKWELTISSRACVKRDVSHIGNGKSVIGCNSGSIRVTK